MYLYDCAHYYRMNFDNDNLIMQQQSWASQLRCERGDAVELQAHANASSIAPVQRARARRTAAGSSFDPGSAHSAG